LNYLERSSYLEILEIAVRKKNEKQFLTTILDTALLATAIVYIKLWASYCKLIINKWQGIKADMMRWVSISTDPDKSAGRTGGLRRLIGD
jgi:hypothetical protein